MQQVTVDAARWLRDGDGAWLAFRVGSDKTAMDVCDRLKAGKEYNLTLKRKGRQRLFLGAGEPAGGQAEDRAGGHLPGLYPGYRRRL